MNEYIYIYIYICVRVFLFAHSFPCQTNKKNLNIRLGQETRLSSSDAFLTKKQHDYKCDIDFIQQFIKEEFNINTLMF